MKKPLRWLPSREPTYNQSMAYNAAGYRSAPVYFFTTFRTIMAWRRRLATIRPHPLAPVVSAEADGLAAAAKGRNGLKAAGELERKKEGEN